MARWIKTNEGTYVNLDNCESVQRQDRWVPSKGETKQVILFTSNSGDKFTVDYNQQKIELRSYLNDPEF